MEKILIAAYRAARARFHYGDFGANPRPAMLALLVARKSIERGQPLAHYGGFPNPYAGQPFKRAVRFVDGTERAGLRFVGFADELARRSVEHRGWYTDEHGDRETLRGAVYQLPARGGRPLYLAGYREGSESRKSGGWQDMNPGTAVIDFEPIYGEPGGEEYPEQGDGARTAALAADRLAELMAEEAREYNAAWEAGVDYANKAEEIAAARKSVLADLAARKAAKEALAAGQPMPGNPNGATLAERFARICELIRSDVADNLETIRERRREREELLSRFYAKPESYGRDLFLAFCEGANVLPESVRP